MKASKSKVNIVIDENYCKGCSLCIHFCTQKILEISPKINTKGYPIPCAVTPEKCAICRICEHTCPEFAITVEEEKNCAPKSN